MVIRVSETGKDSCICLKIYTFFIQNNKEKFFKKMGAVPVINVVILVHNIFTQGTVIEENWHEYRLYVHYMETGMFVEDIFSYLFYFIQFLSNLEFFVIV